MTIISRLRRGLRPYRRRLSRLTRRAGRTRQPAEFIAPGSLGTTELALVAATEGMLSAAEAQELARCAGGVPADQAIVEVGSYRGRSTVAIALGSRAGHGAPVFAVEPHEPFVGLLGGNFGPADRREFFRNVLAASVVEEIRLLNISSEVVTPGWTKPVGFVWIDGDHTYEGARRDANAWEPHLVVGGIVAFHDALNPELGPIRVIDELVGTARFDRVATVGQIVLLRKLR